MTVGESIQKHRKKYGLSREELGNKLLVSRQTVSQWEKDQTVPTIDNLLRPLEIYKNRPIFYSLGDFMLHNESVQFAPEDMYEKYGLTSDDPLCEIYRKRSRNYTVGLLTDSRMMEAVIPYFEMEDGELKHLELLPIELGFGEPRYRLGNPRFCPDRGILQRLAQMSAPYGTKIHVDERGLGVVEF